MRGYKNAEANQHGPHITCDESHYGEHHGEALAVTHRFARRFLPRIRDLLACVLRQPYTQHASCGERVRGNKVQEPDTGANPNRTPSQMNGMHIWESKNL